MAAGNYEERNIESEKRYNFASLLWVRCVECRALNGLKKGASCKKERSTSVRCEHKDSRCYDAFRVMSYWNAEIYGKLRGATS